MEQPPRRHLPLPAKSSALRAWGRVPGKGRKVRTVYLTDQTTQVLAAWLKVRGNVALDQVHALFVVVGPNGPGTATSARGIRCLADKYLRGLGLKAQGISCHALRPQVLIWPDSFVS